MVYRHARPHNRGLQSLMVSVVRLPRLHVAVNPGSRMVSVARPLLFARVNPIMIVPPQFDTPRLLFGDSPDQGAAHGISTGWVVTALAVPVVEGPI